MTEIHELRVHWNREHIKEHNVFRSRGFHRKSAIERAPTAHNAERSVSGVDSPVRRRKTYRQRFGTRSGADEGRELRRPVHA